eukprot:COSAG02_NODE_2724_length_8156_cov_146.818791_6_plen_338_part_00
MHRTGTRPGGQNVPNERPTWPGADMGHLRMVLLCGAVAATSTADTVTPAFRCVPFARRPGDDPPPQPNATNCMVGCSWNGTDCALQTEFTQLLWEDEFHGGACLLHPPPLRSMPSAQHDARVSKLLGVAFAAVVSNSSWGVWDYANPSTMPPNRARANALKDMAYSAGAVSVAGGLLKITAQHHAAPLRVGNLSAHYSTGRLQTEHRQSWGPFGRFEARAKVPAAHGENAAVWLMPESAVSGYTEFDIVESLGKNSSVAYGTYHYGEASTASFGAHRSHLLSSGAAFVSEIPLSAGFHVYGQIWTEEGLWCARPAVPLHSNERDADADWSSWLRRWH